MRDYTYDKYMKRHAGSLKARGALRAMEEPLVEEVERPFELINSEAGTPWGGGLEGLTVRLGVLNADVENIREVRGSKTVSSWAFWRCFAFFLTGVHGILVHFELINMGA